MRRKTGEVGNVTGDGRQGNDLALTYVGGSACFLVRSRSAARNHHLGKGGAHRNHGKVNGIIITKGKGDVFHVLFFHPGILAAQGIWAAGAKAWHGENTAFCTNSLVFGSGGRMYSRDGGAGERLAVRLLDSTGNTTGCYLCLQQGRNGKQDDQ